LVKKGINTKEQSQTSPNDKTRFVLAKSVAENVTAEKITIKLGKATIEITKGFDNESLSSVLKIVGGIC